MDEHGSKAVYIGGGLIIALVIIGLVFGVFQAASLLSRNGTSRLRKRLLDERRRSLKIRHHRRNN